MLHRTMMVILAGILISGCLGTQNPPNKIEYYTLEYTPIGIEAPDSLPAVIRIERFAVAPVYNSHKIIYSDSPYKRNEYGYHKWRANPGDLVSYFIARDMKSSALFGGVSLMESGMPHTHVLTGSVDEFFEFDGKKSWEAVLAFHVTLSLGYEQDVSKNILFQKSYQTREPCPQKNPQGLAEAMSMAMRRLSHELMSDIIGIMNQEASATPVKK